MKPVEFKEPIFAFIDDDDSFETILPKKKNYTSYTVTFILSVIVCILAWQLPSYASPLVFFPLLATNLFLPFVIIDCEAVSHKWQILFFFLVPYASFLYIFADGLPDTFFYFKNKIRNLS